MDFSPLSQEKIAALLQEVEKPVRYLGGEVNAIKKDPSQVKLKVALVFPDAYEMGESHVGLKILYKILNDQPDIWAERVYAPWPDMEQALIRHNLPLFSLESHRPLHDFDLIGITLPYELVYTNILTILDRGGVPLLQRERSAKDPIVIGGGNCAFNPEPMADFLDAVVVGDGEEVILKLAQQVLAAKEEAIEREALLKTMSKETGVYVPSFFEVDYFEDGRIKEVKPRFEDYTGVTKVTVTNLDQAPYPTAPIVPHTQVIHDRVGVEVQRGCVRACRFCQAGYIYRPERQRSPNTVKDIIDESLKNTGQEEASLLSLSIGDYQPLNPLLNELFEKHEKDRVAISLPATRTETLTPETIQQIKRVRKTGFTIAPEAGTPRMRRLINKGNEREDLMRAVDNVFREGWRLIKFYYMCGLPLEEESDVLGIAEEAHMALDVGKKYTGYPKINVSVSSFVPKPFTPFQWEPQRSIEEVHQLHGKISHALRRPGLNFKHHNVQMSYLEGVFSRGDRRLSHVVLAAYQKGARFDEWKEQFNFELWEQVFEETGVDPDFYVTRRRERNEILPWDHLFIQMDKDFLWSEWEAAHDLAFVEDCSTHRCTNCGVCDFRLVKNVNYRHDGDTGEVSAHSTRGRPLKNEAKQHLASYHPESTKRPKNLETQENNNVKLRVRYTKLGESAFLSHLDLMTLLRRAMARARIPIGFSDGFHPHMKVSMGPALSLGLESEAEYLDVELTEMVSPDDFQTRMNAVLPKGIQIKTVSEVPLKGPSIMGMLREQIYHIDLMAREPESFAKMDLPARVDWLQNVAELPITRERKRRVKQVDIRPLIKDLKLLAPTKLRLVTKVSQQGGVKPAEVLKALLPTASHPELQSRVRKMEMIFVA